MRRRDFLHWEPVFSLCRRTFTCCRFVNHKGQIQSLIIVFQYPSGALVQEFSEKSIAEGFVLHVS